jgi:pyruvate/2-oxoglutarate dehydrogenase complex dihydrolipoamide acyltransferase (E2) component
MTPQEEQALVQIIVQCVRAVLDAANEPASITHSEASSHRATPGSRFIDIVPQQAPTLNGRQDGYPRELANKDRDDVRKSLRRFLRDSEPPAPPPTRESGQAQPARPQQAQKRQLITQEEILAAHRQGISVMVLQPDAIVTPLARQVAKEKGIILR